MPADNEPAQEFTDEEVAVLARHAGLAITEERLPLVTREVNIANRAAMDLLTVPDTDVTGVAGTFDPAWPAPTRRDGT